MEFLLPGRDDNEVPMRAPAPLAQHSAEIPRVEEPVRSPEATGLATHRSLLGRDGRGESLATLGSAAIQDRAPRLRLHSLAKSMLAKALDSARLIRPLHLCGSSLSWASEEVAGPYLLDSARSGAGSHTLRVRARTRNPMSTRVSSRAVPCADAAESPGSDCRRPCASREAADLTEPSP